MGFVKKEGVREASSSVQKMADVQGLAETRVQEGQHWHSDTKMKPRELTQSRTQTLHHTTAPQWGGQGSSQKPGLGQSRAEQKPLLKSGLKQHCCSSWESPAVIQDHGYTSCCFKQQHQFNLLFPFKPEAYQDCLVKANNPKSISSLPSPPDGIT